jgi:NADH-quinone oxidoreductase subunit A
MLVNFFNLSSYGPILIFLIFASVIACAFVLLPLVFNVKTIEKAKLSSYECGSYIVGGARGIFDARFYLVAMLFIIFDLEILFLLPWALNLKAMSLQGFFGAILFLFILTLGFIYEWKKGALEWE